MAARTGDGISLFAVEGDASGLTRTPLSTMDQTRKQAKLEFSGVKARLLGEEGAGWAALSKTLDQVAVCLRARRGMSHRNVVALVLSYFLVGVAIADAQVPQSQPVAVIEITVTAETRPIPQAQVSRLEKKPLSTDEDTTSFPRHGEITTRGTFLLWYDILRQVS